MTNIVQKLTFKSVDGVLGIRTLDRRMVGADESTEQWRIPDIDNCLNEPKDENERDKCCERVITTNRENITIKKRIVGEKVYE